MIDCSHGNSQKNHVNQINVAQSLCEQIKNGNDKICGVMLESNLFEGKQELKENLNYGQSITDACLSWQQTLPILTMLAESVSLSPRTRSVAGSRRVVSVQTIG